MAEILSGASLLLAALTFVTVLYQIHDAKSRVPPGGVSLKVETIGDGDRVIRFQVLGAWVLYDIKVETVGCAIIHERKHITTWSPGMHRLDGDNPLLFRLHETEPMSATVSITWVSGQDKSTIREGIRYSLHTQKYESLKRYRAPRLHRQPARWVERKTVDE